MPEGLDHAGHDHAVTVRADGTVLRRRRPGSGGLDVAREATLLDVVGAYASLPVPRVLRTWPARGLMEMERVPGSALLEHLTGLGPRRTRSLAERLGDFVASVAAVPPDRVAGLVPEDVARPDLLLAEAVETCDRPEVLALVPAGAREGLDAFLAADPLLGPAPGPVLVHGDLGAEHVFVDGDEITGVIDWSDAVLGDPALDLGLVLRDLGPAAGEVAVARFASHGLGTEGVLPRAWFFGRVRALEDLAYGVDEGLALYRDNAVRAVAQLF